MIQPEEALKGLDIFLSSMEKGKVEVCVAGASSKRPSTRPFRKDHARKEQRPRLGRSSSEDAGFVRAPSYFEIEDLSEDWSSVSVAELTLTQSHSLYSGLDMYTVHDRYATLHDFPLIMCCLLCHCCNMISHSTQLKQQLTLYSLRREIGETQRMVRCNKSCDMCED